MKKRNLLLMLLLAIGLPWVANAQESIPYTEGFENMSSASDLTAAGWISYQTHNGSFLAIETSESNVHSGSKALNIDSWDAGSTSDYVVVGLPTVNAAINTLQITFSYKVSTGTVYVGYLTDANDASTFVSLQSFSSSSSYTTKTVELNEAPASAARIAIKYLHWYRCYVDDIEVKALPNCLKPTSVTATPDGNITWEGEGSTWNLNYKASSASTWTEVNGLTSMSYTIPNLAGLTTYNVRVQNVCDDNTTTDWTTATFTTTARIPLVEPFNSSSAPTGWTRYNGLLSGVMDGTVTLQTTTSGWNFGTGNGVFDNHAKVNVYGTSCKYWLVTPALTMENNVQLSFDVAYTAYSGSGAPAQTGTDDKFVVLITTDGGTTWTILRQWDNAGSEFVLNNLNPTPATVTYDLSSYAGQSIAVAFYAESTSSNADNNLHIDNVSIDYIPSCFKPTELNATNITANAAELSWTANSGETAWKLYWKKASDENYTEEAITSNPYTLSGLDGNTEYEFYVVANCGGSDGESEPSNTRTFVTPCEAFEVTEETQYTYGFETPDLFACWTPIAGAAIYNYSDQAHESTCSLKFSGTTNNMVALPPFVNATNTLRLEFWTRPESNTNSSCGNFAVGYMTDLADANSFVAVKTYSYNDWTSAVYEKKTVDFANAPENAYIAMRQYNNATNWFWFVDDVTVKLMPSCLAPTGLAVVENSVTAHEASLTWTAEEGATFQWTIDGTWTDTQDNTVALTGLTAETDYTFTLRKKCSDSDLSEEIMVSFHTPAACPAPTNFDVDDITNHTATLSWQGTSNEYQVSYRTAAYVEGLEERFDNSSLPTGWICYSGAVDDVLDGTVDLSSASGWSTNSYALGEYNIKANIYGTASYKWIVSPEFTFNGEAVEFDVALTDFANSDPIENVGNQADDRFVVLVYADDEWHILREWNNSGSAYVYDEIPHTGTHVSIDLSLYSGKTIRVAFYGESTESGGDNDLHIDNVAIGTPVPAGEMQYASNITEQTVTLQGLLAERKYEAWLQGDCGSEGPSAEVGPITFTTDIACPAPIALTHANVKSNQANLSWTNGGAENWVVAYKKTADENFTEKNVTTADVTIDGNKVTYTLTGLDETTEYTVKVRDNCEPTYTGDGESEWTSTVSFTTMSACEVENVTVSDITHFTANVSWDGESADGFTVKYRTAAGEDALFKEDFESASSFANWTFTSMNTANNIASGKAGRISDEGHNNTYGFRFSSYTSADDYNQYLVSPELTVTGELKFYAKQYSSDDNIYVGYSTTTSDLDAFTWDEDALALTTSWAEFTHELPNNVKYIAFHYYGDCQYYAYLDDITIGAYEVPAGDWESVPADDSPANLNSLTAGTKYDLTVVPDCDATLASEIQQFTTVSADEKWFITEGSWGRDSNWEPVGAPTIDQNVTLLANATIESDCVAEAKSINGTGTGTNAKTLTIKDGGKLKHLNSGVRATVEKVIRAYSTHYDADTHNNGDYYLIANPLTSNVTPDAENNHLLSGNYDLYNWDYSASDDNEWRNYEANPKPFTYLNVGAYGYLYANETGATLTYTGTINAYTNSKSRYCGASSSPENYDFPGWYLLGNPYMYDAYLATATTSGTALPYIKMNTTGDGFTNVAAGTPIEPMEGFFYQQATTSGYVYVVTSAPAVQSGSKLNMNLRRNNKQLDNAILVFGGDQQLGKMTFRANSSKIFMPVEGKDYAITSVEGQVGEVPVSFKAENNGTYSLSFTSEEVTFSYLHLIDNMTGNDVNLLETPSYTFDARTTDYASRFKLVFAVGSSANDETFGFVNASGNFCIFGIEGEATVQVIDVLGHVVSSETFSGSYERKINGAPGVYMVRLIQGNDVKVQKVVVR